MSWFFEFFAGIAAFGFWTLAIIALEFIFLFSCTRREAAEESLLSGIVSIIFVAVLLIWAGHINIFKMIWLNPGHQYSSSSDTLSLVRSGASSNGSSFPERGELSLMLGIKISSTA